MPVWPPFFSLPKNQPQRGKVLPIGGSFGIGEGRLSSQSAAPKTTEKKNISQPGRNSVKNWTWIIMKNNIVECRVDAEIKDCPKCRTRTKSLLDSHISSDLLPELDCPESIQATQHNDRPRFSIISGPTTETGANPGRKRKRPLWMRVFRLFGFAFKRSRCGLKDRLIRCLEDIFHRAFTGTIPVLNALHAGSPCNERHCTKTVEGHRLHRHIFDVTTVGLHRAEEWLNDPAPTVELDDPSRVFERFDPMAGQQVPMGRLHTHWQIHFPRVNTVNRLTGGNIWFNPIISELFRTDYGKLTLILKRECLALFSNICSPIRSKFLFR